MTDRASLRRRVLVATSVPLVLALIVAAWLIWARAEPSRSGGFCANATAEFAEVLDASSTDQNGGVGLTPDVLSILEAARSIDVDRLEVNTPREIEGDVARLRTSLPSKSDDTLDPEVQAALARVLAAYLDHCR